MTKPRDESDRTPKTGHRADELPPLNKEDLQDLDAKDLGKEADDVKGGGDWCGRSR